MEEKNYIADIFDIWDMIPHRYPFLMIDRVTAQDGSKWVEGYKNVTINEPFFQGHFPGDPVMPGVLILEAMAQLGGVIFKAIGGDTKDGITLFLGIDKAKFRGIVRPGDRLDFRIDTIRASMKATKVKGTASVDGKVVCTAELMATMIPKEK